MVLKEELGKAVTIEITEPTTMPWVTNGDNKNARIEQCLKILDEFAVGFAVYISTHCNCELGNDTRSYKELLEIYKKEKAL